MPKVAQCIPHRHAKLQRDIPSDSAAILEKKTHYELPPPPPLTMTKRSTALLVLFFKDCSFFFCSSSIKDQMAKGVFSPSRTGALVNGPRLLRANDYSAGGSHNAYSLPCYFIILERTWDGGGDHRTYQGQIHCNRSSQQRRANILGCF